MQMNCEGRAPAVVVNVSKVQSEGHTPSRAALKRMISNLKAISPDAFRLAVCLSVGRFTIPVAQLVQEVKFGDARDFKSIGEVLVSGLVISEEGQAHVQDPNSLYFRFYPEAREILLRSLREEDADLIANGLQQRVSGHLPHAQARNVRSGIIPGDEGNSKLDTSVEPYAELGLALLGLRRLRGSAVMPSSNALRIYEETIPGNVIAQSWEHTSIDEQVHRDSRPTADASVPLFEAKLLVVGSAMVGKSWALARLCGEDPNVTVGEQTTYGVYCGQLSLPHPSAGQGKVPAGTEIHFNTWDFGGQGVYNIISTFFFTQDAIILLVWNPRVGAEKSGVREWLRMINLRAGGSVKVIMVASHFPQATPYLPSYYRDRLPPELSAMIVDEIAIDSELGYNIPELRAMIAKHAAALHFMGELFPVRWKKAREAVASLNPPGRPHQTPHITYEWYQAICRENGISDESEMFTLAILMRDLGRVIYFGDPDRMTGPDPLLANIMVLDGEWLTRAFVQVLEDKETNESGGLLDHSWLSRIWGTHDRKDWLRFTWDEHPFLIRLMNAFGMSYVLRGSEGKRSLIPQLLPTTQPNLPWLAPPDVNGIRPVRLICRMEGDVDGLMPRFIVQTAPYHSSLKAFWRYGVFLRDPTYGNEALVTLVGGETSVVTITVSGAQPSWFLGELHRTLLDLLAFWPGLKSTFYIGCPTRVHGGFCKGEFAFDFVVEEDKEEPDESHKCQVCRKRYTARELLSGYRAIEEQQTTKELQAWSLAKAQAPCPRAFTLVPADRSKYDPRQFVPEKIGGKKLKLTLLSEHSYKEIVSKEFGVSPGWVKWIGPLARIGSLALSGVAVPMIGLEAKKYEYAAKVMKDMAGVREDGDTLPTYAGSTRKGGLSSLLIVIGASEFPGDPTLSNPQFARSAEGIRKYFLDPAGFALPEANCLWLFDTAEHPTTVYDRIEEFLRRAMAPGDSERARDLIIYYIGHGFFRADDQAYHLADQSYKIGAAEYSYRFRDLLRTVEHGASTLRKFYIVDACFSGVTAKALMSANAITEKLIADTKQEAADYLPNSGTALLCATSPHEVAIAPTSENYTMFTGALLDVLKATPMTQLLTLEQLHQRTTTVILDRFGTTGVRPQIHKPDQKAGDIAAVPLFPGSAAVPLLPGWPSGANLEDLHQLLKEIGLAPHFGGMQFVKIRGKGYLWVSKEEAEAFAEPIPDLSYIPR